MTKALLIVESPTKERTISRILGKGFEVRSSYGHIRDLPQKELGVDVDKNFEPKYMTLPKAKKILPGLLAAAAEADTVYLATDFDREGEAIAWHLSVVLKLDKKKAKRITFHEITTLAITGAMKNPRELDNALVDAQVARRVLDRLVGYRLSPLLWKKVRRGLSAGRVQSVAVRLLCDREAAINAFKPEEYWSLTAHLKKSAQAFEAALFGEGTKRFDKFSFRSKEPLAPVLEKLKGASWRVSAVSPKERRRQPAPPFTTASLQQDASRRLHFSASRTMLVAQQLYEGLDLGGEGVEGLITYMRTDSVSVAKEAQEEARAWLKKEYGPTHVPEKHRIYKTKSKGAQEAHEAIRPTKPARTPASLKDKLTSEQFRLYELIWQRFLASQMAEAVYDTLAVDVEAAGYVFRASGHTLRFPGFLAVYGEVADDDNPEEKSAALPPLVVGDVVSLEKLDPQQHFTEPPPRYNEASLVKVLEEHGIGRPSTYAPTLQTILDRGYARLEDRRFSPTELGKIVNQQLMEHFPNIVDVNFTAKIESLLDDVADAKTSWRDVVRDFYTPFAKGLEKAETAMQKVTVKPQETKEKCSRCGSPLLLRENRFGRFLACSGYPNCRLTIPLSRDGEKILPQPTSEICPTCGKGMVMKSRGRTRYLACVDYPTCKTTFSVDRDGMKIIRPKPEMTDEKCQKCGKAMLKRVSRRGPFLACSGFPRCRNIRALAA